MSKWAIGGLVYLIVLAILTRVAADLLSPTLPLLLLGLMLALVFRRLWRGF